MPILNNYPAIRPILNLDFVNAKTLDPRINFSRSTTGTYYDGITNVIAEQNLLTYSQNYSQTAWSHYNTFIGSLSSNLILNGDFTTDTSNWVAQRSMTIAVVGGRCEATTSTTSRCYFYQSLTTIIGQKYRFTSTVQAGTYTGSIEMSINNVINSGDIAPVNPTSPVTITGYFTATGTTSLIQFVAANGNTAGLTFYVDDVVVQQEVSAANTAPDGTSTAELITVDNVSSIIYSYISQTTPSVPISNVKSTYSIYAKANTNNYIALTAYSTNTNFAAAVFNLSSTGSLGETYASGTGASVTSNITSVANNWFRCSMTFVVPGNINTAYISVANTSTGNTWDNNLGVPLYPTSGNSLYIWGAQMEQRSANAVYANTTTSSVTNYIPKLLTAPVNQPRFDCNPITGQNLGLLVEKSSTNLALRSQEFDNITAWSKINTTVSSNSNIAPDGTLSADTLITNTTNGIHRIVFGNATTVSSSTTYTSSVYVKPAGYTKIALIENAGTTGYASFDCSGNGTVLATGNGGSGTITPVGNGWYRVTMTITTGVSQTNYRMDVYVLSPSYTTGSPTGSWVGDGTSGVYLWGAQLEAFPSATSYIATQASQVARSQDIPLISGTNFSSWFNPNQGTIYCSADVPNITGAALGFYSINNGVSNGYEGFRSNVSSTVGGYSAGANFGVLSATVNVPFQTAMTYNNTSTLTTSMCGNGINISTVSNIASLGYIPTQIKLTNGAGFPFTGHIRKFAYYDQSMTNTQLQSLTGS